MSGVLERQLVRALDKRLAVFAPRAADGSLLQDELALHAAAYMIGELLLPCCCMFGSKSSLQRLLEQTGLCCGRAPLAERLAGLVYDDLVRCNGLG